MTWVGYALSMGMKSQETTFQSEDEAEEWYQVMRKVPGILPCLENRDDE